MNCLAEGYDYCDQDYLANPNNNFEIPSCGCYNLAQYYPNALYNPTLGNGYGHQVLHRDYACTNCTDACTGGATCQLCGGGWSCTLSC
jgi:hypothetical protein